MKTRYVLGFIAGLLLFAGCGSDTGFWVNGVIEAHKGFPLDQAVVEIPGCGNLTANPNNGIFYTKCDADNSLMTVFIHAPGYAPAFRVIRPDTGMNYSLFVPMGMKLQTTQVDVTGPEQEITASTTGFNVNGKASAFGMEPGKIDISLAYWDCVFMDKAVKPFFGDMLDENGNHLKVLPIAIGYVAITQNGSPVKVRNGQGFNAVLTSADLGTTNVNSWSTKDKLYYFDKSRGVFIEKKFLSINQNELAMRFAADATGFWVWAKPMVHPSCTQVQLSFPNGKGINGVQVDMDAKYITGQAFSDATGTACVESEGGYVVKMTARIVNKSHVLITHRDTLSFPVKQGSCETGCPTRVTLTFQCQDDSDCVSGYQCLDGLCKK